MKSSLYAATMSRVYSEALAHYASHGHFLSDDLLRWEQELRKVSHRSYTEASLATPAGSDSIFDEREHDPSSEWKMVGAILEATPESGIVLEVRNAFNQGDELEILPFRGEVLKLKAIEIMDLQRRPVARTKPTTLVRLPFIPGVLPQQLIRQQAST
jgi:U32 family peptidase